MGTVAEFKKRLSTEQSVLGGPRGIWVDPKPSELKKVYFQMVKLPQKEKTNERTNRASKGKQA